MSPAFEALTHVMRKVTVHLSRFTMADEVRLACTCWDWRTAAV